jgi:hypothetical protein
MLIPALFLSKATNDNRGLTHMIHLILITFQWSQVQIPLTYEFQDKFPTHEEEKVADKRHPALSCVSRSLKQNIGCMAAGRGEWHGRHRNVTVSSRPATCNS